MEERRFVLPAILIGSLSAPLVAHAGGKSGAQPVVVVPIPVPVPAAPASPVPPAPPPVVTPMPAPVPAPSASAAPPAAGAGGKPSAKLPAPKTPLEAAVQQIVMLERGGRPIAVGVPLNGDGRIVTALSPLTHGNQIVARYPEGQRIPVKLSYSDRAWDLALLTPLGDARRSGLKASHDPPPAAGTKVHALNYVRDKQLGSTDIALKAKGTMRGNDSAELADAYELPPSLKPADAGAPLVNDQGEVVGLVARACSVSDQTGCTLALYGAPVSAVRDFLRSAPPRRNAWVGLEVVAFDAGFARGVRVATVVPDGPAAASGLRAGPPGVGDVVLAVGGKPVPSPEAFAEAIEKSAGTALPARLTVLTDGRYHEVLLTAGAPPDIPSLAPVRNDRVYQSNPPGTTPPPAPAPNPYR